MTDPGDTDLRLVEDIRQGRSAAETALYERFAPRVYYLALRYLRSREDAEDAQAETFLRVLQALREGRLRTAPALTAFILETTRNVIRERARQTARVDQLDPDSAEQSEALSVEVAFVDPYSRQAIERTIDDLRPRERAFLRMYYYDELPAAEISERLGIKTERLRLVKSRALKRFRNRYERLTANVIQPAGKGHSSGSDTL